MPKVSIVVPNFNYGQYLPERIESLLAQTYQDFELIILDDASKDNSIEVINRYASHPKVRTQLYSANSGCPYQRWNDGAALARGEYLLIAGADDSCHPELLRRLVEQLDGNPNVGIAYSQSLEIDGNGKCIGSLRRWTDYLDKQHWSADFVVNGRSEFQYLVQLNTIFNASAVLMRREVFERAGTFDPKLRFAADWMLWAKMLLMSDLAFVSEPLNYFRVHGKSVSDKAKSDGLRCEEDYLVTRFICERGDVPAAIVERMCEILANNWILPLLEGKSSATLRRHLRIYRIASVVDPLLKRRLLRKWLNYCAEHSRPANVLLGALRAGMRRIAAVATML